MRNERKIIRQTETQLKYNMSPEAVEQLKAVMEHAMKNGKCVTLTLGELGWDDPDDYEQIMKAAKIKLLVKKIIDKIIKLITRK